MSTGLQGLAYFPGIDQLIARATRWRMALRPAWSRLKWPRSRTLPSSGLVLLLLRRYGHGVCRLQGRLGQLRRLRQRLHLAAGDPRSPLDVGLRPDFGQLQRLQRRRHAPTSNGEDTQDLARLCLDAMGEQGYDVSQMPGGPQPAVHWDYAVPAQALADLVGELGCRVVLRLDGTVSILPDGDGQDLPSTADLQADSLSIGPPERPDSLVIVGPRFATRSISASEPWAGTPTARSSRSLNSTTRPIPWPLMAASARSI